MPDWKDIPLNKKLFKNLDEDDLTSSYSMLENCFVNEAGGISRFPGLREFVNLGGNAEIYLDKLQGDLIAVGADGRTHRVNRSGQAATISGPLVGGGRRAIFARTASALIVAAGAQPIMFDGVENSVLSPDCPLSTHVGVIDNYVLAVELGSGRFQHSDLNDPRTWDGLDTFAADGRPDNINAMLITPFNEILMTGEDSIEQFERYTNGTVPFFRRWSVGDGIIEPYTLCHADNAAWGLNSNYEFARFSGQTSTSASDDIGKDIEDKYRLNHLEALNGAWAAPLNVKGQKFILLQSPFATNSYGTKGVTYLFDLRQQHFNELFGWDTKKQLPTLWPGCSIFALWGKVFVGGRGKIYELTDDIHNNDGLTQQLYGRTAHYTDLGPSRIERVRVTLKRGVGSYTSEPLLTMRVNCDHQGFGMTQTESFGLAGHSEMIVEFGNQGAGDSWQFEFKVTDDCPVEIRRLQVEVSPLVR